MESLVEERSGAFLIGAHIGNFDMLRVIAREADIPVNVLMYSRNAARINDALEQLDPDNKVRIIDLDPSSAKTAFEIRRCLARGEFVAVLGDRVLPSASAPTSIRFDRSALSATPEVLGLVDHLLVDLVDGRAVGFDKVDLAVENDGLSIGNGAFTLHGEATGVDQKKARHTTAKNYPAHL